MKHIFLGATKIGGTKKFFGVTTPEYSPWLRVWVCVLPLARRTSLARYAVGCTLFCHCCVILPLLRSVLLPGNMRCVPPSSPLLRLKRAFIATQLLFVRVRAVVQRQSCQDPQIKELNPSWPVART